MYALRIRRKPANGEDPNGPFEVERQEAVVMMEGEVGDLAFAAGEIGLFVGC